MEHEIVEKMRRLADNHGAAGITLSLIHIFYLCDTKQKRILVLDQNYKLVRKYEGIRPLGENQEEDYMFLPTRIVVDASGNMYVLVQNEYQGIMQIDSDGRFISFVGGNKVTYDPVTKLWKKIMSKEQRAQLEQFLPVEYTNPVSYTHLSERQIGQERRGQR